MGARKEPVIGEPHVIPSDKYGDYFNGTYLKRSVLLYVLNEHGKRCLPCVLTDVWTDMRRCSSYSILYPLEISQVNGKTIIVFPPMHYTLQEYLKRVKLYEPVHPPYDRDQIAHEIAIAIKNFSGTDDHRLVHRYLSSQTIFVSNEGRFFVAGLFLSRDDNGVDTDYATMSNLWKAPEILAGHNDIDFACDVFSFGIILTELDTLQAPYHDKPSELANFKLWVVKEGLRPTLSDKCPDWYKSLVEWCLASEPSGRPDFEDIVIYQAKMKELTDVFYTRHRQ